MTLSLGVKFFGKGQTVRKLTGEGIKQNPLIKRILTEGVRRKDKKLIPSESLRQHSRLPGTGQVLRCEVSLFHSCVGHGEISLELLLHPRHFG